MLSKFFEPVYHFGRPFDRAMTLIELDALREPERTQFPLIGKYLEQRGIRLVEIPPPQIVYREPIPFDGLRYVPDYFITNNTKIWLHSHHAPHTYLHPSHKHEWGDDVTYDVVSLINHPRGMHDAFEAWCQKLYGFGLNKLVARFHRAAWLPTYYPESLGTIWPTKFFYPSAGYAGKVAEVLGTAPQGNAGSNGIAAPEQVVIGVGYILAKCIRTASVLFVLDRKTPIYRITDQTVCAGWPNDVHQLVVEYREEPANICRDLAEFGIDVLEMALGRGKLVPPTRANVEAGYRFGNHMNKQILEMMNE